MGAVEVEKSNDGVWQVVVGGEVLNEVAAANTWGRLARVLASSGAVADHISRIDNTLG
jgi:hypothetical protein